MASVWNAALEVLAADRAAERLEAFAQRVARGRRGASSDSERSSFWPMTASAAATGHACRSAGRRDAARSDCAASATCASPAAKAVPPCEGRRLASRARRLRDRRHAASATRRSARRSAWPTAMTSAPTRWRRTGSSTRAARGCWPRRPASRGCLSMSSRRATSSCGHGVAARLSMREGRHRTEVWETPPAGRDRPEPLFRADAARARRRPHYRPRGARLEHGG